MEKVFEIEFTGADSGLRGVGRSPDGRAVFVPGAIPGERALVQITREKERFCEGTLTRVLRASDARRTPACPYFGACGGCAARHMDYTETLILKRQKVEDALIRIGGLKDVSVSDVLGMDKPERARNKAEYGIENGKIGCARAGSRSVVEIEDCLLQREESVSAMKIARKWLNAGNGKNARYFVTRVTRSGELMAALSSEGAPGDLRALSDALFREIPGMRSFCHCRLNPRPAHALDGTVAVLSGQSALTETLMGLKFSLSAQTFFQVNPSQTERLYAYVAEAARLTGKETVLDAYCGAGAIALSLAKYAKRVIGVEVVGPAVKDAKENARRNGLSDAAQFIQADAARALPEILKKETIDALVVDPPRKGLDASLTQALAEARIPRAVYVSCDPATLARDLKALLGKSAYRVQSVRPVDMFPWTEHVETVTQLVLRN